MKKKILKSIFVVILLLPFFAAGCEQWYRDVKTPPKISSPRFSFDNDKIIFFHAKGNYGEKVVYEISSHKLYKYNGIPYWPNFSRDGKKYTYVSGEGEDRNIYVSNVDGSGVRQLTHNSNANPVKVSGNFIIKHNAVPSFSPDGTRIIYVKSGVMRKRAMGGEMLSHWDVYEVDIATGKERHLTDYRFYTISQPYYLSDGKRFVFSGDGPKYYPEEGPKDSKEWEKVFIEHKKKAEEYEKIYHDNRIFIIDGGSDVLKPAFTNGEYSSRPMVSWNDTILFLSRTNEMDGSRTKHFNYDLFVYRSGEITRLTKMESYIFDASISADGLRAVFLAGDPREAEPSLWMVSADGTGLTKINIPWEQMEQPKDGAGGRSK